MVTVRRNYVRVNRKSIEKDTKTHQMRRLALDPTTVGVLTASSLRTAPGTPRSAVSLRSRPATMRSNTAWCVAAAIAADLLSWLRLLCLDDSLAEAEPKTLRYRIPHTAAVRIVRGQRKRKIRIPETRPWARDLEAAYRAAFALARPDPPSTTPHTPQPEDPTSRRNRRTDTTIGPSTTTTTQNQDHERR
jgi:hypothetical protein